MKLVRCDQCQREEDGFDWIRASREQTLPVKTTGGTMLAWQRVETAWDFCSPACVTIFFAAEVVEEKEEAVEKSSKGEGPSG